MFSTFGKLFSVICLCFELSGVKVSAAVRQCCPPGTYLFELTCSDNKTRIDLECRFGKFLLDPNTYESDKFSLESNGSLLVFGGEQRTNDGFCVGKIQRNQTHISEREVALACFNVDDDYWSRSFVSIFLRILMILSTVFLLLTLYIYAVLPNLKDLQGKCVIAFISSLICSYITLFVLQTFPETSLEVCVVQAAFLYFFTSSSFFWNNVITFNIWKSVRNIFLNIKEKTWIIIYIGWGFGIPFLMVVISFILQYAPGGNHIRPNFGEKSCWFRGKLETWSYFYGPVSVILFSNILMFLHSSWTFWKSYRESSASRIRSLRYKCIMYLKLFLLMGISWIFEVISYATSKPTDSEYLWFATDCINCAQGIIIFLVLVVFRQKVRLGLLERKLFHINWPESWAKEKLQESSALSIAEEVELASQKLKIMNESPKENGHD